MSLAAPAVATIKDPDGERTLGALLALDAARTLRATRVHYLGIALKTYGDGDGAPIAGCERMHFPDPVKEWLRLNAVEIAGAMDRARSLWKLAGRRPKSLCPYVDEARVAGCRY